MDFEVILPSEKSQTEKDQYCMISFMKSKKKSHEKRDQTCGYQGERWGKEKLVEGGKSYKPPVIR